MLKSPRLDIFPLALPKITQCVLGIMHSYKCKLYCVTLSVSDLEQAETCEKYNDRRQKNW